MSATIQARLFQTYFSPLMQERLLAPNVFVGAKRFPVQEYFLDEFIEAFPKLPERVRAGLAAYNSKAGRDKPPSLRNDATTAIVDVALASVRPGTAILIFLPGLDEIEGVVEQLQGISDNTPSLVCKLRVFAVHSVVDINDQTKSIGRPEENECNIIVATNIAETSLTIPDLRIVVDAGMSKRMTHDAQRNVRMLVCGWCSKSAAKQRAGRTGRVGTGMVVRMYPRATFEAHMPDFDPSEFYPLEYSVLQVRHHLSHYGTIQDVMSLLIEPPEPAEIAVAIGELVKLGALDEAEHVTSFGRVALRMPVDLRMTRGLMAAAALGCAAEMVVIVAGLSMQKAMFARPIRPFFDTETEFISAIVSVARTSARFERIPQSDIHTFLSLFAFSQLPRNTQVRLISQVERADVAFRSLSTFAKSCRNIANSLLGVGLKFHPDDEQYLAKLTAFQGHRRGVVDEDDEDEDDFGANAAEAAKRAGKGGKSPSPKPAAAAAAPDANPLFPWEFRAFTDPSHNAMLQVALATASDCTFDYVKDDKSVPPIISNALLATAPAVLALPYATLTSLNPAYLTTLLKIQPVGFLACTPTRLPYYFARTIVFVPPPCVMDQLRAGAPRRLWLKQYTSANSPTVKDYEASFTKVASGYPATLTISLTEGRAVLSYGLQELGVSGHAATVAYKDPTALPLTIIKNAVNDAAADASPSAGMQVSPPDSPPDESTTDRKAEKNSTPEVINTPAEDEAFIAKAHRLQLVPIHPAIRGLLMAGFIHRTKKILMPVQPPSELEPEGDAEPLKDVLTMCPKMVAHAPYDADKYGWERWSTFCTPDALPVVPITVQHAFAAASHRLRRANPQQQVLCEKIRTTEWQRSRLRGLCFGVVSFGSGSSMSLGSPVVIGGTPLQQMLCALATSTVADLIRVDGGKASVELSRLAPRSGGSVKRRVTPTFISAIAGINLRGAFNATPTSTLCSTFGAPLHGLVSLLAASLLVHTAKTPSQFQRERTRLLQCLRRLESISALDEERDTLKTNTNKNDDDSSGNPAAAAAFATPKEDLSFDEEAAAAFAPRSIGSFDLRFDRYRFRDHSTCLLPNIDRFLFEDGGVVGLGEAGGGGNCRGVKRRGDDEDDLDSSDTDDDVYGGAIQSFVVRPFADEEAVLPRAAAAVLEEVYGVMRAICRRDDAAIGASDSAAAHGAAGGSSWPSPAKRQKVRDHTSQYQHSKKSVTAAASFDSAGYDEDDEGEDDESRQVFPSTAATSCGPRAVQPPVHVKQRDEAPQAPSRAPIQANINETEELAVTVGASEVQPAKKKRQRRRRGKKGDAPMVGVVGAHAGECTAEEERRDADSDGGSDSDNRVFAEW